MNLDTYEPTVCTPRRIVRRNQARAVLHDLDRRGIRVTQSSIELYAIARYGGEPGTGHIVRGVVAAAMKIHFGVEVRRVLPSDVVIAMIQAALEEDVTTPTGELLEVVLREGDLPWEAPSTFSVTVSRYRRMAQGIEWKRGGRKKTA